MEAALKKAHFAFRFGMHMTSFMLLLSRRVSSPDIGAICLHFDSGNPLPRGNALDALFLPAEMARKRSESRPFMGLDLFADNSKKQWKCKQTQ